MERTLLQARIIDNNLLRNAGKYFIDESSDCIKQLNLEGKSAFLGILNKKGVYTIIGEEYVYYRTALGKCGEILHEKFSEELHNNGCRIGKGYIQSIFMYRNIILNNNDKMWLYDARTMFSIWNTIIWIQEQPSHILARKNRIINEKK